VKLREEKVWQKAFLAFLKLDKAIVTENLFSTNEHLEDIATVNLKYLLCQYYLGEACYTDGSLSNRLMRVEKTVVFLNAFLDRLKDMKIFKPEDFGMFYRSNTKEFDKRRQMQKKERNNNNIARCCLSTTIRSQK